MEKISLVIFLCFLCSFTQANLAPGSLLDRIRTRNGANPNLMRSEIAPLVKCGSANATEVCLGGQICNLGRCQCPHPMEQYFFYSRETCEVDAGRPCVPDGLPCTKFSTCEPDPMSRTNYSCLCVNNMETDGFYCVQPYRGECSTQYWGYENGCNFAAGQECIENRCECYLSPDQVYDNVQKRCVARVGYPCTTIDIGQYSCASNAYCAKSHHASQTTLLGVCKAKE